MARIIVRALMCLAAAVAAWLVTEPMLPTNPMSRSWQSAEFTMVVAVLAAIGLAAGIHQGMSRGGRRNVLVGGAVGAVFALVGGLLGYQIGGSLANSLFGDAWYLRPGLGAILPRTMVAAIMGTLLGAGIGIGQFNLRGVMSGAFGGLIGSGLAGAVFDPIGSTLGSVATGPRQESGTLSRAVLWALTGFCVGLFTALIEQATRQAWLRLVLGHNEGKDWPIDSAATRIGRDERAHIPLFGDPNVTPLHATIVRNGPTYELHDAGSALGTGHNGMRVAGPVRLSSGDTIQVGAHQLQFLMKAGAARKASEGRATAVPMGPSQPVQPVAVPHPAPNIAPTTPTVAPAATQLGSAHTVALVAISGPLTGQTIPVLGPLEVGREAPGIALGFDAQASRRHALLAPSGNSLSVTDLGSTNGTYVNGQKIQTATANRGDTVTIGTSTFRVE